MADQRTTWERLTTKRERTWDEYWAGKPEPPDERLWVLRKTDDVNRVVGWGLLGVTGAVAASEVAYRTAGYVLNRRHQRAVIKTGKLAGDPTAVVRTLTPAQVRRIGARARYEAAFAQVPSPRATTPQLEAALRAAEAPKKHLVRLATAAGMKEAAKKGKLDLARELAPALHRRSMQRALATIQAGGKPAPIRTAPLAARNASYGIATIAANTTAAALKTASYRTVGKLKHVASNAIYAASRGPAGRMLLRASVAGVAGYGLYKLGQYALSRPAAPEPSKAGRAFMGDASGAPLALPVPARASATAPAPVVTYERTYRSGPKAGTTEVVHLKGR